MSDRDDTLGVRESDPVGRFREEWRLGRTPNLDRYLGLLDSVDSAARLELLRADQHYRWQSGFRVSAAQYVDHLPIDAVEEALVLVWSEVGLRRAAGEKPTLPEYVQQFPLWADHLSRLFEFEETVGELFGSTASRGPTVLGTGPTSFTAAGYELLGEVGRGAMGVVYKARQVGLDRVVALKVLRGGEFADAELLERCQREAVLAARLQHPNIVQVFEFRCEDGQPFIAMEFVDGITLAQVACGLPQPPRDAARQVETLATAIHFAHQNGVIHRDLKPSNVLISQTGVAKVADFGLAKPIDATTATGGILGTPAYMAPEQATGKLRDVGPSADVYALGVILYELLTSRVPFRADTSIATLHQVLTAEPTPPARLLPGIPRDLDTICRKCLEKDHRKRYASAAALAEDLRRFQAGEPILARPVSPSERAWRWAKRNPAWATAVLLLIVTAVAGLVMSIRLDQALGQSNEARGKAETARIVADENRVVANEKLWESRLSEARAHRSANRLNARRDSLALLDEALHSLPPAAERSEAALAKAATLRDEVTAALALFDVHVAKAWAGWPSGSVGLTFDAELGTYARAGTTGEITVRRVTDDAELYRLGGPGPTGAGPWLSPDGRLLAAHYVVPKAGGDEQHFWLWRLEGAPRTIRRWQGWQVRGASFAPDSLRLAVQLFGGGVEVIDPLTGWQTHLFRCGPGPNGPVAAFHPTRPVLAVANERIMLVFDLPARVIPSAPATVAGVAAALTQPTLLISTDARYPVDTRATMTHPGPVSHLAWNADGNTLASVSGGSYLSLWDMTRSVPNRRDIGFTTAGRWYNVRQESATFHSNESVLVSTDSERTLRVWDPQGGRVVFEGPADFRRNLQFGRGNNLLAAECLGGNVRLFHVAPSRVFRTIRRQDMWETREPGRACIDQSGRLLVTSSDSRLFFWDLSTGRSLGVCDRRDTFPDKFDTTGALVTSGPGGVYRWPVRADPADPHVWRIDQPTKLFPRHGITVVDPVSGAGIATGPASVVVTLQGTDGMPDPDPQRRAVVIDQRDLRETRISPDGQWVVTATHTNRPGARPRVQVWSTGGEPVNTSITLGQRVREFETEGPSAVRFSPDSYWLATDGDGGQLWRVGTWEPGPRIGGRNPLFSPDSRLVAVESGQGTVVLHETRTGRVVARLIAPNQTRMVTLGFTSDGTKLVCWGTDSEALHIWDFRDIRAELKIRGLDWEWPDFGQEQEDPNPLRVLFD